MGDKSDLRKIGEQPWEYYECITFISMGCRKFMVLIFIHKINWSMITNKNQNGVCVCIWWVGWKGRGI